MNQHAAEDQRAPRTSWSRRLFAWCLNLLMLAIGLAFGAGMIEWYGRQAIDARNQMLIVSPHLNWTGYHLYDPNLMWRIKPNLDEEAQGYPFGGKHYVWKVSTNADGLRSPPLDQPKKRVRILCIGDSRTYGLGVDNPGTYPSYLQELLDQERPGAYEVVNAGTVGYTALQGYWFMKARGLALQPDVVVVAFGYNAGAAVPPPGIGDWYWENPNEPYGTLRLLKDAVRGAELGWQPPLPNTPRRMKPGQVLDTLLALHSLCEEAGVPVVFIAWPSYPEVFGQNFDRPFYTRIVMEAARQTRAAAIDLRPMFRENRDFIFLDDIHLNEAGNAKVADYLAPRLLDLADRGWRTWQGDGIASIIREHGGDTDAGFAAAIAHVRSGIAINPLFPMSYYRLDNLLRENGDATFALEVWAGLAENFPMSGYAHLFYALALSERESFEEATAAMARAMEAAPADPGMPMALARIQAHAGNATASFEAILATLALNPSNHALESLREIYRRIENGVPESGDRLRAACQELGQPHFAEFMLAPPPQPESEAEGAS